MRDVWVSVQHTSIVAGENLSATSCFCICTHTHNPGWSPDHLPHARSKPEGVRKIYSIREKNVSFVHKPLSESQESGSIGRYRKPSSLRGFGHRPGAPFTVENRAPSAERAFTGTHGWSRRVENFEAHHNRRLSSPPCRNLQPRSIFPASCHKLMSIFRWPRSSGRFYSPV